MFIKITLFKLLWYEGAFWGEGNVLYLDYDSGYMSKFMKLLMISSYKNFTLIKLV